MPTRQNACLALSLLLLLFATPTWADVPANMNVQGRLTDGAGEPVAAGLKIFTFKIFDAESGGTEIWPGSPGEDQTLSTDTDGLWTARVGAVIALDPVVFADTSRWLQVTVNDGINPPETLPRIKLNTAPWAARAHGASQAEEAGHALTADLALNADHAATADLAGDADRLGGAQLGDIQAEIDADVAAHAASADHDDRYYTEGEAEGRFVNTTGDMMTGGLLTPELDLGSMHEAGHLRLYMLGWPGPVVEAASIGGDGGFLNIYDDVGTATHVLEPDPDGQGGFFWVVSPNGGFEIDGSVLGSGDPRVHIVGSGSYTWFDGGVSGNGSVNLPTDAVSAAEVRDEPGLAHSFTFSAGVSTYSAVRLDSVTVDCPAAGYVVVVAHMLMFIDHVTGTMTTARAWISEDGGLDFNNFAYESVPTALPTARYHRTVSLTKVEAVSAGTNKYVCAGDNPDGGPTSQVDFHRVHLTAMYFPTQYGTVVSTLGTLIGAGEPSASEGRGLEPSLEILTVADQAARLEAELSELRSRLDDVHRQLSEQAGAVVPAPGER